ncbi:MAG: hypothetical protein R6U85_07260, partial [Salinivirgaceae bacterium]
MKTNLSIIFTLFVALLTSQSIAQLDEDYETLLLEEEETQDVFNTVFKPIIGVGQGMLTFMGDIKGDSPFNPTNGYWGTKAVISRTFGKSFEFDLFFMFGKFGGEQIGYTAETTPNPTEDYIDARLMNSQNKNFYTDITVSGVNFTYNFIGPFGRKRPILPYVSLGIETLQFRPKTDIVYTDENGNDNPYHYWSDGTIRNQSETSNEPSVVISRDYEYETDARNATDQDYSFFSLAVPVEVGVNVTVTDRMTLRLGSSLHLSFTDYLDNYSNGNTMMDNDFF